jgi:hypothetical protein
MGSVKLLQRKGGKGVKVVKRPRKGGRVVPRLRDWEVMKLREDGLSYPEISQAMLKLHKIKMSPETCRRIVVETLTNMASNFSETTEQVRQIEVQRLDSMLQIATKLAKSRGKAFNRLAAMDRVIKIGERRSKLVGLEVDKPQKHEHVVRIYHGIDNYEGGVTVDTTPLIESGSEKDEQ